MTQTIVSTSNENKTEIQVAESFKNITTKLILTTSITQLEANDFINTKVQLAKKVFY